MKILINTPLLSHTGGVANHYKGLLPFWSEKVIYNFVGRRKYIPGPIALIYDYPKFVFLCAFGNFDRILLNPSLAKTAIKRDAIFLRIAKIFRIKTLVFFHGWDEKMAKSIAMCPRKFLNDYQKSDGLLVLSSKFKSQLEQWGIKKPIYLTTTKVDDGLLYNFDIIDKKFNNTLLFLARVEENKGVLVAIDTLRILNKKHPKLKLKIAGDGGALQKAKDYVKVNNILNVEFLGNISGKKLIDTFVFSDIYILPTWHGEGMPTSILESMAFGLPIISRPVGGLIDFFEEGKMGDLQESINPKDFAEKIEYLLENSEKIKEISIFNHGYAKEKFMASKVALELEKILLNE